MKNRTLIIASLLFLALSQSALAVSAPTVAPLPDTVDANTYKITVYCDDGATVTVVGGPSDLAPVTDGKNGDLKDGKVVMTVGVAQNSTNTYSITCALGGEISASAFVSLKEVSQTESSGPAAPVLNKIPEFVTTAQYIITGTAEANANIYVRGTDGKTVASTQAGSNGTFKVTVTLAKEATNRFNVSAENEDGAEGPATQAVIRQTENLPEPESEGEEPADLNTSSQMFFGDVNGHWAEDYINQLYEDHVVSGKSEGVFAPEGLITRAELTKIAILAFGHSVNPTPNEHPFQDVPLNSWYAPYIEEAKRLGFVSGYESGGFGPNDFVNRAAALKILLGAAGLDAEGETSDFSDVSTESWFAPYVGFAKAHEIVGGYADGRFGPGDYMTRAQVAKVVVKLLDYLSAQE